MVRSTADAPDLQEAFAHCAALARGHYENFTVASWLLPKRLRPSMYAVYAFCRHTDDLGDEAEGDRVAPLDRWEGDLRECFGGGAPQHPIMVALQATIEKHHMPQEPFLRLIEANRIDQRKNRYGTFAELLEYCIFSANPVGHMVLHVFGYQDVRRQSLSDSVCSGLQLANFWQDVGRDWDKGRIYLPLEDMQYFGYTEEMLAERKCNAAFQDLMAFEVTRTRMMFREGGSLVPLVDGRLRLDLRLFTAGGLAVLDAIKRNDYDVLSRRPVVTKPMKFRLMLKAFVGMGFPGRQGAGARG